MSATSRRFGIFLFVTICFFAWGGDTVVQAQPATVAAPVVGKSLRYVNPLPLPTAANDGSPVGVTLADVTALRDGDKVYLLVTGGGPFVSEDLVHWTSQPFVFSEGSMPIAPDIAKYNGAYYISGNDAPLYRSANVLGPYAIAGQWTMADGRPFSGESNGKPWTGSFDVHMFVDDDNKPYLYSAGRSTDGIYVVPLDPDEPYKFTAEPVHVLGFNPDHVWERGGDRNEFEKDCWIEGPWVVKRDGVYYLEYSAPGTQWLTYATGVYTSRSPLGPFTYAPNNPVLRNAVGVVTGTAHGSLIQGPDDNWWQFYTIVLANPPGGRRIGMDPVGFDENGNLFVSGPNDTPQWAPGIVADPARNGDSGSKVLSMNKFRAINSRSRVSSQRPGHDAAYAADDLNGTYWMPMADDAEPSLTIELAAATSFDPLEQFIIDSCRIEFLAGGELAGLFATGRDGSPTSSSAPLEAATSEAGKHATAHQYRVEVSTDGKNFTTVLDKTNNNVSRYTEFDEIPPTECNFVRLTITAWPHNDDVPLGILEFTAFGKSASPVGE